MNPRSQRLRVKKQKRNNNFFKILYAIFDLYDTIINCDFFPMLFRKNSIYLYTYFSYKWAPKANCITLAGDRPIPPITRHYFLAGIRSEEQKCVPPCPLVLFCSTSVFASCPVSSKSPSDVYHLTRPMGRGRVCCGR